MSLYLLAVVYVINFLIMVVATVQKIVWVIKKIRQLLAKRRAKKAMKVRKTTCAKKESAHDSNQTPIDEVLADRNRHWRESVKSHMKDFKHVAGIIILDRDEETYSQEERESKEESKTEII